MCLLQNIDEMKKAKGLIYIVRVEYETRGEFGITLQWTTRLNVTNIIVSIDIKI